jgi:predicted acetyltransferase
MNVKLEMASIEQKIILKHLLELYNYDFSEFDGSDVNEDGLYGYKYLDNYWTEPSRFPFLVIVDDNYAGLVLVSEITKGRDNNKVCYSMSEFFIMKKYRKYGIGKQVAFHILDLFPGEWKVAQTEKNIPAQKFWLKVISEYTNNNYVEIQDDVWEGPIQSFLSRSM